MDHETAESRKKLQILPRNYKAFFLRMLFYVLIFTALVYLLQGWLIYQPERYPVSELEQAAHLYSVQLWPTADEEYRGLVRPRATGARGTIVVFHGNAGSAFHRLHYIAALERLGLQVVLAEYPGYGAREGRRSERALIDDAKTTVLWAERDFGGPLYLWGESLGCGVATALVADPTLSVEGLVLVTPFTSLPDMAQAIYRFYPARWLVRDRYDSIANLQGFRGPVAILVAGDDELVPREQAERLHDSLNTEKKMWIFEGAGHNSWPARPEEMWWQEVTDFLGGHE
jgi:pimeloyl-ACP methyl ester carboxylesterase